MNDINYPVDFSIYIRHDAAMEMDNKHFITLASEHIAIIALVGCIFPHLQLVKILRALVQ